MNFYRRFPGDYGRDTAHLSLAEHGAYTLLLDTYYATGRPLPADYQALYRICRAHGAAEQKAVRNIADQFFPIAEDGTRRNRRADRQIPEEQKRIETAKQNGTHGGRRKEPGGLPKQEPNGNPAGSQIPNQTTTEPVTQRANSPSPSPSGLTSLTPLPPTPRRGAGGTRPPEETQRGNGAWRSSEAGIKAKARELGIGEARQGETWQAYIQRIAEAYERVGRAVA